MYMYIETTVVTGNGFFLGGGGGLVVIQLSFVLNIHLNIIISNLHLESCRDCEFESHTWQGVNSIQHYVMKFVSDLRQVDSFLWVLLFPPPIKLTTTI